MCCVLKCTYKCCHVWILPQRLLPRSSIQEGQLGRYPPLLQSTAKQQDWQPKGRQWADPRRQGELVNWCQLLCTGLSKNSFDAVDRSGLRVQKVDFMEFDGFSTICQVYANRCKAENTLKMINSTLHSIPYFHCLYSQQPHCISRVSLASQRFDWLMCSHASRVLPPHRSIRIRIALWRHFQNERKPSVWDLLSRQKWKHQ